MKLAIKRHVLQPTLERAFSVAAKTPVAGPELQSVFLSAEADGVSLTGSDTELTLVSRIAQVDVEEPGSLMLPLRLRDIVRLCHDSDIVIETDERTARITNDQAFWEVRLDPGEYPRVAWSYTDPVLVPKEPFTQALARVRPAVASDENREDYRYIQVEHGLMRGTDGRKFVQVEFNSPFTGLLPLRAVQEVSRRLRGMALPEVGVSASERAFVFKFDDDYLIVLRHNVNYPDLESNLLGPALMNNQPVSLDRKLTLEAVRRVAVNADPDTNYMTIELVEDTVRLLTLDKFGNQSHEQLDINWQHPLRVLGVNHRLFADMLSAMTSPSVTLWLGEDDTKHNRMASIRFAEEGFIGVLHQLRTDLGDAAKGSDRVRPAQQAPIGWGHEGMTAEATTTTKRARRAKGGEVQDEHENRDFYMQTDDQFDFEVMVKK